MSDGVLLTITASEIWLADLGAALLSGVTAAAVAWFVVSRTIASDRKLRDDEFLRSIVRDIQVSEAGLLKTWLDVSATPADLQAAVYPWTSGVGALEIAVLPSDPDLAYWLGDYINLVTTAVSDTDEADRPKVAARLAGVLIVGRLQVSRRLNTPNHEFFALDDLSFSH